MIGQLNESPKASCNTCSCPCHSSETSAGQRQKLSTVRAALQNATSEPQRCNVRQSSSLAMVGILKLQMRLGACVQSYFCVCTQVAAGCSQVLQLFSPVEHTPYGRLLDRRPARGRSRDLNDGAAQCFEIMKCLMRGREQMIRALSATDSGWFGSLLTAGSNRANRAVSNDGSITYSSGFCLVYLTLNLCDPVDVRRILLTGERS